MARYRLTIEYDGGPYHGFQAQKDLPSVQGALQAAILGFSKEEPVIFAAGRTDTGVHALGQVIHFDLERAWPARTVQEAMNFYLVNKAVAVLDVAEVGEDFHARFSAKRRAYLYRILNRRGPPVIERGRVWHLKKPLDAQAMYAAAQHLVGHHDFTTFRDMACQSKSPVKTLDEARVWTEGEEVRLSFVARSFLHRQVRSMTGVLAEVGAGRWSADDLVHALQARDRKACGPVAPACGLFLVSVEY